MGNNEYMLYVASGRVQAYRFSSSEREAFRMFRAVRSAYKPLPVTLYVKSLGEWKTRKRYLPGLRGWLTVNAGMIAMWLLFTGPFLFSIACAKFK